MPKKPKKILIFESDKVEVQSFSNILKNKDYGSVIVSEELNRSNVVGVVEKIVEEENPNYVVLGNVYGRHLKIARKIEALDVYKKIRPKIIMYGNHPVVKSAIDRGYEAVNKKSGIEKVFEIIEEI